MPPSNPLPPKENALFKRILRCYEHKQYKNGLKFAKQILSNPKFAEHGETLAMKGLTLNCLGRKDEAYEYVRRGLRNDLRSPVCWHVYGLLQRSDKKYDEAIKCYRNALKWEKENIQILRDLSLLQIQMRDLEGYKDTRYQLFMLRPTQRASWIGFAMSYHLLGDYEMANSILDAFRTNQMKGPYDYEHSELLLYQNMVLAESGQYERALQHLQKFQSQILDKLSIKETCGEYYLKLKRFKEAESVYEDLLKRNPENVMYYQKLIEAKQYSDPEEKVAFFEIYKKQYPKAIAPRRLQLTEATEVSFERLVDEYLRHGLHKGIPPLFVDLRSLYKNQSKADTIEKLVLQYIDNLTKSGTFSADPSEVKQPASALLWAYYFAAQHFDYKQDTSRALKYIDDAIEHTPTLIELFIAKGRIFKHAGNPVSAYQWLEEAQAMDTADRYVNSKCARYMLRAGHVKRAEEMCAKFTREGVPATENLNEMQCMWFQTETAAAYQRLQQWGEALKKAHEVDRHFSEVMEDQFDFHSYCMRKMTLRSYVGLLRLEDVLRSHPFYFRCARVAIQVYLRLHSHPLQDVPQTTEPDTENLAPSELKKLRNKQRKAKRKAEQESALQAQVQVKREQHYNKARQQQEQGDPEAPQLDELIPDKLARVEDPLEQAIKFLLPLRTLAADRIDTHLMAFEIYFRKERPLLMLQSVKRAWRLDSSHPQLHDCLLRFVGWLREARSSLHPHVAAVIDTETQSMVLGRSELQIAEEYVSETGRARSSQAGALWGARALRRLAPGRSREALALATGMDFPDLSIQGCVDVLESLRDGDFGPCEKEIEEYLEACRAKYPYAIAFKPPAAASEDQENCETTTEESTTTPLQPKEIAVNN